MQGFINLDKPAGLTSHDCVAKVRRSLHIKRVGHGGTLDPAATGVLPIAVGKATRLLSYLPEEKAYRARIRFGVQTATDDLEGEILETRPASELSLLQVEPQLATFVGRIAQIPPAYSALQRGGKRLYELARAGEAVEVPQRTVEVREVSVLGWYPGEYPELEVAIACGPGTYIRAIARDLGTALGTGATLAALRRTLSCGMDLADSISLAALDAAAGAIVPPEVALSHLAVAQLAAPDARRWCQGQVISLSSEFELGYVQVVDEARKLLGMGEIRDGEGDRPARLIPKTVLV